VETVRTAIVPVVSAFLLLAGVVLYAAAHPDAGAVSHEPTSWKPLLALIAWTTAGGYLVFVVIVLVFHVLIAGQRDHVITSALAGGGFLAGAFVAASIVLSTLERRRPGSPSSRNHRRRDVGRGWAGR
jgi:hypothetical protein